MFGASAGPPGDTLCSPLHAAVDGRYAQVAVNARVIGLRLAGEAGVIGWSLDCESQAASGGVGILGDVDVHISTPPRLP